MGNLLPVVCAQKLVVISSSYTGDPVKGIPKNLCFSYISLTIMSIIAWQHFFKDKSVRQTPEFLIEYVCSFTLDSFMQVQFAGLQFRKHLFL